MIKFFLLSFLSLSAIAEPFKIVIIADQGAVTRAGEFQAHLMTQPPFNRMRAEDLQITVRTLSATEAPRMNCLSRHTSTEDARRLVTCDQRFLRRIQRDEDASLAVAITSNPSYYGGSGGQIPVGTINLPNHTLIHEMLHTCGVHDEYPYTDPAEQRRYCRGNSRDMNSAFFRDVPPYTSDPQARSRHPRDVPWMARILPIQGTSRACWLLAAGSEV